MTSDKLRIAEPDSDICRAGLQIQPAGATRESVIPAEAITDRRTASRSQTPTADDSLLTTND